MIVRATCPVYCLLLSPRVEATLLEDQMEAKGSQKQKAFDSSTWQTCLLRHWKNWLNLADNFFAAVNNIIFTETRSHLLVCCFINPMHTTLLRFG